MYVFSPQARFSASSAIYLYKNTVSKAVPKEKEKTHTNLPFLITEQLS